MTKKIEDSMLEQAQYILDKVIGQITGFENPMNVEQFLAKYAFDVRLPSPVNDSITGEVTWAQSTNPSKFITLNNARKRVDVDEFMIAPRPLNSMTDILNAWQETNYTSTERQIDSIDIFECDNIYNSQNIYRSQDIHNSKHVLFSDSALTSEYIVAQQRSHNCFYCARIEDSKDCSESFNVSWSSSIVKSAFIHDCYDMFECLFCSHLAGKKYCVANIQLTQEQYLPIKEMVMRWILGN
ncbi:MAG: hypothetical protein KBF89_07035 [Acidimicrobiia bacterium]|nr:hypothetical protein [Acidimicrobiia bacterium]